jgi:hypothetical protein
LSGIDLEPVKKKKKTNEETTQRKMFMLKKKKQPADTAKEYKKAACDALIIAVVFIAIRATSVFLNPPKY